MHRRDISNGSFLFPFWESLNNFFKLKISLMKILNSKIFHLIDGVSRIFLKVCISQRERKIFLS